MPAPHVCIILLNYNRGEDTLECLASLLNCAYPSFQIMVIDNASTDGSTAC
jgi:GT2 family glycosyltransferase